MIDKHEHEYYNQTHKNIKRESPITVLAHHNVIGTSSNKHKTQNFLKRIDFVNTADIAARLFYIFYFQ